MGVGGTIEAVRADAVKLESNARRARPCVCGGSIAFDLSPPAAFTCSHDYRHREVSWALYQRDKGGASARTHTLQPLVAVVLVDEDIVWGRGSANDKCDCRGEEGHMRRTLLGLARLLICLGRKGKGVHLRVLREDAAHGGIVGHVE